MKKIIVLLGVIAMLTSCGHERVYICDENPFIVDKIKHKPKSDNLVIYYNSDFDDVVFHNLLAKRACIIAPRGLYNIGDTIKINK